jgi:hypothetical protein
VEGEKIEDHQLTHALNILEAVVSYDLATEKYRVILEKKY